MNNFGNPQPSILDSFPLLSPPPTSPLRPPLPFSHTNMQFVQTYYVLSPSYFATADPIFIQRISPSILANYMVDTLMWG